MVNEQLLTKEAFLKLTKEQAWDHYEKLAKQYLKLKNKKIVISDQLDNKAEIVRSFKANREQQRLRDRAYGSSAHARTNELIEEAISLWWEMKSKNPTKRVGGKILGRWHNEHTQIQTDERASRLADETPAEDGAWPLSLSTYNRINTAASRAWEHSEIINDSDAFLSKTLEYKRGRG